ncbi:50S ribosomal protein L11 methyltransferase [Helicobacter baculiformis]|uniref:50S ribosomal protein L11 methyltransferase n=1 Tax=Helicobacter baculiformis TaxID=427351 RepID=A0ABV7ZJ44_9HELI|nr:50S ribosomal protein L11 methyltransferase [Helicobacter baculiformis]
MCQDVYFKTFILPTHCSELFADCLLDFTQNAIEEIETAPSLDYHYFGKTPLSPPSAGFVVYSRESSSALLEHLKAFCCAISERLGENIGFYHYSSAHPNLDWVRAYKEGVEPITCGRFHIMPSWNSQTQEDLIPLILDPSLAFGTGRHESTRLLLQEISQLEVRDKLSLDVGCGSGVLSLALAQLGAYTHACDTDPLAIAQTQKNFKRNHLTCAHLWLGSIQEKPESTSYDVVVINIVASVIIQMYADVLKASKKGGLLLLSGILDTCEREVLAIYSQDFTFLHRVQENEWVCLTLCRHSNS